MMLPEDNLLKLAGMRTMFPGRCMMLLDDVGSRCYKVQKHEGEHLPFESLSAKQKSLQVSARFDEVISCD